MKHFVQEDSIVRRIWGKSDTVLFIFAGASAEFALNKAVDWLYFTGRLPADPIGRLFSTVAYARQIVFSSLDDANAAIDKIKAIHVGVEKARNAQIPDWAYRDVLFMLIHYSIASFELLERQLTAEEKLEAYDVFYRLGSRMGIRELPSNYNDWLVAREHHLNNDLQNSQYTKDLFKQYKKHLGAPRYYILRQSQILVVPKRVNDLLKLGKWSLLTPAVPVYKFLRSLRADWILKEILLPSKYKSEIKALDQVPA